MIYNPSQGMTAANGLSQFALPKRGGQNQLMESRTWPGLMAECGLTSGSDKEDWRKKKKNTAPPPPDQFHVQWAEDAEQTEQLDMGLFPSE